MKLTVKILSLMLVITMLFALMAPTVCYAEKLSPNDITASFDGDTSEVKTLAGKVIGLLRNISVIAGVILLTVIGIKFMLGSAEEKAEYKKSLIPLVVGIIVVMSATTLTSLVFGFFED